MTRRVGQIFDPKNEILSTLRVSESKGIPWKVIVEKSGISKGAISKHLNELIDEGKVKAYLGKYRGRRTTLYQILEEGTWVHNRNVVTTYLNEIKDPVATQNVLQNGQMLIGSILEVEKKSEFNKIAEMIEKMVYQNIGLINVFNNTFKELDGIKKASIMILYDQDYGFKPMISIKE
ncbi:MAG: winged helix-turn-helix transcriptional regulator [Candidatus Hodarchaeales archaeon]